MHMSDLDGLLVARLPRRCLSSAWISSSCKRSSSAIAPVNVDVRILQMPLAELKEFEAGESSGSDLNGKQGL